MLTSKKYHNSVGRQSRFINNNVWEKKRGEREREKEKKKKKRKMKERKNK